MITRFKQYWRNRNGQAKQTVEETLPLPAEKPSRGKTVEVDLGPDDPLYNHLLKASGVVELDKLNFDSPALQYLKDSGIQISIPLVSQGELIGVLNLGNRLSEQDYSTEDHRLLYTLATQAAPALRVAQLARQQQVEARLRERLEQEMRVARIIQQTLLPKELPELEGWKIAAHWQPARAVSGDFYDFFYFPDGKLGIAAGDVTDKGVPAALVMATTRSVLRAACEHFSSPGKILARANEMLCPDIPPNMFVTCLYLILDPANGVIRFANAGHNLPVKHTPNGILELRATGMPLGLMLDMPYDEFETQLDPGDSLVIYSDGLVEAHNTNREMFGFPRLREVVASVKADKLESSSQQAIHALMKELVQFTGPDWEQEDDVTLVVLEHYPTSEESSTAITTTGRQASLQLEPATGENAEFGTWRTLADIELASEPGNERKAVDLVLQAIAEYDLPDSQIERLKTAVSETAMNAIEHGNKYREELPVKIKVQAKPDRLSISITDRGGGREIPAPENPDLEAKLAGLQSPRGWGLFIIKNMVDEMNITTDDIHHTVELILKIGGDE